MALLGPAFQIGRSALAAYQAAIAVVGQNIANVGNPNYTRQSGRLAAELGGPVLGGIAPGAGVRMSALQRHIDEAIESQLRGSLAARSGAETRYRTLNQVESLYNELSDQDLSTQLTQFFGAFSNLQTTPTDSAARNIVLANADNLIRTMQRQRSGLLTQIGDLNRAATAGAQRVTEITGEIARLNEQIVGEEARAQSVSGPLRDRRDGLLRDLSELMDIQVRQQDNGSINVYVGSEPLVEFNRARGLKTEVVHENGLERAVVRFSDNNSAPIIREGRLAGIVDARDKHLVEQLDRMDQLARGLIYEVNRVHSAGTGLVGMNNVTGSYAVQDPTAALNSSGADLDFPIRNGTFVVHVRDKNTGQIVTRQIDVDLDGLNGDDTTLASLANDLDEVPGLTASVTSDNRLHIETGTDSDFWISDDSTGAAAALGVGSFFEGADASTIAVRADIKADPRRIAASLTGLSNDGDNAGRLAVLGDALSEMLGNQSIADYQAATTSGLAVTTASALTSQDAADSVYASLTAQRESISGVSIDEEAINLTKFERAFQGATRYIGVLDSLADEILTIVR